VSFFSDVRDFHLKFGQLAPATPGPIPPEVISFRIRLLREELDELERALMRGQLAEAAQESVDLAYVALGVLVNLGADGDEAWDRVHEANMAKEPHPRGMKPVKPAGWQKPDLEDLFP